MAEGGQRRLTVEVVYETNEASAQRTAEAVRQHGVRPLSELNVQAQRTGSAIAGMHRQMDISRILAWAGAWTLAYRGIRLLESGIADAITQAMQFDAALRNVNTIARLSERGLGEMRAAVVNLSTDTRAGQQPITELAKALYQINSAGIVGAKSLDVLRAAGAAARAGLTDTNTAATGLVSVLNAYGLSTQDAARVSDVLFKTVEVGVPNFENLSRTIGKVAATSAIAQIPVEELGLVWAAVSRVLVDADHTTDSLNRVIIAFLNPTEAMTEAVQRLGFDSAATMLKQLGLIESMKRLYTITGDNASAIRDLFQTQQAFRGAAVLMGNDLRVLTQTQADWGKVGEEAGATQRALAEQMKSHAAQVDTLRREWERLKIEIGTGVVPVLSAVAKAMADVLRLDREFRAGADERRRAWEAMLLRRVGLPSQFGPFGRPAPAVGAPDARVVAERPLPAGPPAQTMAERIRHLNLLEQSLRFEVSITDSLQTRRQLLADLLVLQERQIELRQKELEVARREPLGPRVAERETALQKEMQARSQTLREIELAGRQIRQIIERNEAEILQVGQRAFASRMRALESQRIEELRLVEGNREAILAIEKKFILQRLQILEDARKQLAGAETEFASTQIRNIQQRGDLQQRLLQSRTTMVGLGMPLASESGTQVRARFEQLQAIQRASQQAALADAEAQFRAAQATRQWTESASLRAEVTFRLSSVILQQAEAQADLNRQEREALKTAKERDLSNELKLLERRLELINLVGGADVLGVERRLDLARAEAALRQLSGAHLRQELEFARRAPAAPVAPPGLDLAVWERIPDRVKLIQKVLRDITDEETVQVVTLGAQQTKWDALQKTLQEIHKEMLIEPGKAVAKAMTEYGSLFDFVRVQLDAQTMLWARAGDASGKAFADAARKHLQNVFPTPSGGLPRPGGSAPGTSEIIRERGSAPTIINLGGVNIANRLQPETVDDLIAAVMGARGDLAVSRARRHGVANSVV